MLADAGSIHTIRWCKHFYEKGHDVHIITFNKNASINGIKMHFVDAGKISVSGGNWRVILRYRKIKKIIASLQPDIVHSIYATSYGLMGALSGFQPYIITPLGTDILISPKNSFLYKLFLKYTFKRANWITSMAPHMTQALLHLGASKEKIGDLIFGVNTEIFNKKNRQLSTTEFVIVSTRNFEPVYNIPHFLRSIELIKRKIPNLKVLMVGDGTLKQELIELTKELRIDSIVTFLGKVPQSKVVEVLNSANIFVTVSLSDGNSLSLIEAMACGAYPIATDIIANHEWITDGMNGSFVKIDDVTGLAGKIQHVYSNFDKIISQAIPESDRIIAEKGKWQTNMRRMENKYNELNASRKKL